MDGHQLDGNGSEQGQKELHDQGSLPKMLDGSAAHEVRSDERATKNQLTTRPIACGRL